MKLKKILFSILITFGLSANASEIKDTYMEVMSIVRLYCKPGQYFNPPQKRLYSGELESPIIGLCDTDRISYYNIYIDTGYWKRSNEAGRFQLLAHEQMHCLFFQNHVDNPDDFMYYAIRDLTKEQTTQQLIAYLNKYCGDKNGK